MEIFKVTARLSPNTENWEAPERVPRVTCRPMTLIVRDFTAADTDAWIRVRRAAVPFMVVTPASVAFERSTAHPAKKMRMLVAERDGQVIGTAFAGTAYDSAEPGQAYVTPYIHPGHRGRGAG